MAPSPDDPELPEIVHQVRRLSVAMERDRAAFARARGLHPTDVVALTHLLDAERLGTVASPTALARALGMGTAATTAVIDRLEGGGLVRRDRPGGADRRRVTLAVTAEARRLGRDWFGPMIGQIAGALDGMDEAGLGVVRSFLDRVIVALG